MSADGESEEIKKRLEFLLQKTEKFKDFLNAASTRPVSNNRGRGQKATAEAKKDVAGRRQGIIEKDSDAMEVELEPPEPAFRFEQTPGYIKGGDMRDYQLRGLDWMISLYENGINGILADEMGLGKTLQTISLLGYLFTYKKIAGPHLVVAPLSTLQNWANEVKHWCPALKTVILIGDADSRRNIFTTELKDKQSFNVLITSYEMCYREKKRLKKIPWTYLIIDEAQRIKNEKTLLSLTVRSFKSKHRLLLTGTPLQNNLHELWALLNFLLPDIFDSSDDFDNWFSTENCLGDTNLVQRLHSILEPFLLRRVKADVEKGLLPKKEVKIYVGMSQMQREWYTKVLMKNIEVVNNMNERKKMRLENIFMQLRKCTNHPYLFDTAEPGPPYTNDMHLVKNSGKMFLLHKLLPKLKAQGSRVLIFSQMTRMLTILEDYCTWQGYNYCRLDGSTKHEDRNQYIDEYNAPNSSKFIFLLSTRAGGLGINLTTADAVIIYDSDWNPQMDLQAIDRAHRIGQKKQVRVFRLITEHTADVKMDERASMKLRLDKMIIQKGQLAEAAVSLTQREMLDMIRHGANYMLSSKNSYITDEDIDQILADSEERTAKERALLDSLDEGALRTFTLNAHETPYNFEGENFRKLAKKNAADAIIELPKRQRTQRFVLSPANVKPPPMPNQLDTHDYQFYPVQYQQLRQQELMYFYKTQEYENPKIQRAIDMARPLTDSELVLKERLATEAFASWTMKDFKHYIQMLVRFGRDDIANVAKHFEIKPAAEVIKYHEVFVKRCGELRHYASIMEQIQRAEAQRPRFVELFEFLRRKITECQVTSTQLDIPDIHVGHDLHVTKDFDRFLLNAFHKYGMGASNFEQIAREIRRSSHPAIIYRLYWNEEKLEQHIRRVLTAMYRKEHNEELLGVSCSAPVVSQNRKSADKASNAPLSFNPLESLKKAEQNSSTHTPNPYIFLHRLKSEQTTTASETITEDKNTNVLSSANSVAQFDQKNENGSLSRPYSLAFVDLTNDDNFEEQSEAPKGENIARVEKRKAVTEGMDNKMNVNVAKIVRQF